MISRSRSVSVESERLISSESDSLINIESVFGSWFSSSSSNVFSSPCTKGASIDTWRHELLSVSDILSTVVSSISASSSGDGSRSYSCTSLEKALLILLNEPTWLSGKRTIRVCSAIACNIDWRIHQPAYDINLKHLVSSKRYAALIKPKLPSFIKSPRVKPWFWYCFATDTTKRRLVLVRRSNAA